MDLVDSQFPLLDPEQIGMLLEAGAADSLDLFNEILVLFEQESHVKLRELRTSEAAGNFEAMGRAAHALAGSSANIGGRVVWLKAKEIENLCRAGQGAEAATRLADLEETFHTTLAQLKVFVGRLGEGSQG